MRIEATAIRCAVLVGIGAAGCGSRPALDGTGETGTLQAKLAGNVPSDRFASVRFESLRGATVVDSRIISRLTSSKTAPSTDSAAPDGAALFALRAGEYAVAATALDGNGQPVADCMPTTTTASVAAGRTTEVTLGVLCVGAGTGAITNQLQVILTRESAPVITGVSLRPTGTIVTGQPVNLAVFAAAAAGASPLVYRWSQASNPTRIVPTLTPYADRASFSASLAGDYVVTATVADARGQIATVNVPIHVFPRPDPPQPPSALSGQRPCRTGDERLEEFAARCDKAMGGVSVPKFDCDSGGTEPPHQTDGPGSTCGAPNVLNHVCDPGSHFHMLHRNDNNDGVYIAAHCRKKGNSGSNYGDVAVIQYNANNGATCFYQALGTLPHDAPAPKNGTGNFWLSPAGTVGADPCVSCHDSGPYIRSPYLAQLGEVWPFYGDENNGNNPNRPNLPAADGNYLPGTLKADLFGPWNQALPYSFVGLNFQSWKAYSIKSADGTCTSCHRLGASQSAGFWNSGAGTSMDLGLLATNKSQQNKVDHGALDPGNNSPIWMTPGQLKFTQASSDSAHVMQKCAESIVAGNPDDKCSATLLAQGNTCPPPPTTVNGGTVSDDPKSWHNNGKTPLGQPGGKPGFYAFTTLHGPFYQNSDWDPYMNQPPAVASPDPWDPPTKAPKFRGTYLRIYGEPAGQWMVAWGLDATDIQNNNNMPSPPGGPGGVVDGIAFEQIDSIADPNKCGSGYAVIGDMTGTGSPLSATIDNPAGARADVLAGFVGNVSRNGGTPTGSAFASVLRIKDTGGATVLSETHNNSPNPAVNQWFTAESWANGCSGWQASAHFAVQHKVSTSDVVLVDASTAPNVFCYIDGIAGNWAQWQSDGNGGSIQPYAQIYQDASTGVHLKVWPTGGETNAVSAYASCLFLK